MIQCRQLVTLLLMLYIVCSIKCRFQPNRLHLNK